MLVEISVIDESLYGQYVERVPSVIEKFKGRYVIRSSKVIPSSGGWAPDRIILIEFDSLADLSKCFASPEYAELAPMREKATKTRSVVIES